jgi:hypothetical protein
MSRKTLNLIKSPSTRIKCLAAHLPAWMNHLTSRKSYKNIISSRTGSRTKRGSEHSKKLREPSKKIQLQANSFKEILRLLARPNR